MVLYEPMLNTPARYQNNRGAGIWVRYGRGTTGADLHSGRTGRRSKPG